MGRVGSLVLLAHAPSLIDHVERPPVLGMLGARTSSARPELIKNILAETKARVDH